MKLGFIGLGRMGSGLAKNLIRAGYDVGLYDINSAAVSRVLEVGGWKANTVKELAVKVNTVFVSLPMPSDLKELLLGENGLYSHMRENSTVIDVSTIDPQTARYLADEADKHKIDYLECPLGKGPKQAEEGSEPIFVGGNQGVFAKHKAMLERIGSPVYYLGAVEQSSAFKIISNLIGMTNIVVLAEGLRLGELAGINPVQLQALLAETGADSYQLHLRGPWIREGDFQPRFSVNLTAKDIRLGVEMAKYWGKDASFSSLALDYFEKAQREGFGNEDANAVYKVL